MCKKWWFQKEWEFDQAIVSTSDYLHGKCLLHECRWNTHKCKWRWQKKLMKTGSRTAGSRIFQSHYTSALSIVWCDCVIKIRRVGKQWYGTCVSCLHIWTPGWKGNDLIQMWLSHLKASYWKFLLPGVWFAPALAFPISMFLRSKFHAIHQYNFWFWKLNNWIGGCPPKAHV